MIIKTDENETKNAIYKVVKIIISFVFKKLISWIKEYLFGNISGKYQSCPIAQKIEFNKPIIDNNIKETAKKYKYFPIIKFFVIKILL